MPLGGQIDLDRLREAAEQERAGAVRAPKQSEREHRDCRRSLQIGGAAGHSARSEQREGDDERRGEEPPRHEVAADAHDVDEVQREGEAGDPGPRAVPDESCTAIAVSDHQQRDRIAIERVEQVDETLVQQLRLGMPVASFAYAVFGNGTP